MTNLAVVTQEPLVAGTNDSCVMSSVGRCTLMDNDSCQIVRRLQHVAA